MSDEGPEFQVLSIFDEDAVLIEDGALQLRFDSCS